MKKSICLLLAALLLFALAACSNTKTETADAGTSANETEQTDFVWTRDGYFTDADGKSLLSITWMEDTEEPGWYVGVMIGDLMAGWTLPLEGNALRGNLNGGDESAEPLLAAVTEEGEDGVMLVIEGGETYHFTPYEMPTASIFVSINVEGWGNIEYAEGEDVPEIDPDYPYQSAQVNLAEPATYTFIAYPDEGWSFVKWTKDGADFSDEPVVTVLLDESAEYIAVFEESAEDGDAEDGQNIAMNFIGPYVCDRARATVECEGRTDVRIVIEWADSAQTLTRWILIGTLDPDTLTVAYTDGIKSVVTYDDKGNETSEAVEYADGTGTIVFTDGAFSWHEDQAEREQDLVFEWSFDPEA